MTVGRPPPLSAAASTTLAGSALLARIPRRDLLALLKSAQPCSFSPGQTLFQRGDHGDGLYAIVCGAVRVQIQAPNGSDITLAVLGPGEVLGEMSVLDGSPRSATAVASERVDALHVSTRTFHGWLALHPAAAGPMLAGLARRLRDTDEKVAEIALLSAESRVARSLRQSFRAAGHGKRPAATLRLRINQAEMASSLGITRESVNKHLARLKARGIVDVRGGYVTLLQPGLLEESAELL